MIEEKLPLIRQWADVQKLIDDGKLTPAEHKLIAAAKAGEWAEIGEAVPKTKTPQTLIRAPLLRYLILGGCKGCRTEAAGVQVRGAWIADRLDLGFATAKGPLALTHCHIAEQPWLLQTTLAGLVLNRSRFPQGLNAQGAQIGGPVFLRGVQSEGEVRLSGAAITGQLACNGASLRNAGGHSLNAQRMTVKESFFWCDVKEVDGTIYLASAHVADLVDDTASWAKCDKISLFGFTYDVLRGTTDVAERLVWLKKGAKWGDEFHPQPYEQLAKNLRESGHRAEAREILMAKEREHRKAVRGRRRHERRWRRRLAFLSKLPQEPRDAFIEEHNDSMPTREPRDRFLLLHPSADKADFVPPLTLAYAQQDFRNQQRWANTILRLRNMGSNAIDQVFRLSVGYGYKPWRSLYVLAVLIGLGWLMASQAWQNGDFVPNSDVILESPEWQGMAKDRDTYRNPAESWADKYARGEDYETFHSLAYAVGVVIPIISLGQEAAWAPSTNRSGWGWHLWWVRWFLTAFGWIVTAIGAAAVTGIIRRD